MENGGLISKSNKIAENGFSCAIFILIFFEVKDKIFFIRRLIESHSCCAFEIKN